MVLRFLLCCFLITTHLELPSLYAGDEPQRFYKVADDIERKYTTVGNIGLTITNFGTLGTRNSQWPQQPSCEYPRGSRIEHIYQGGVWVGALLKTANANDPRNNQFLVSTGANDRSTAARRGGEGYEYNAEGRDSIIELSSLSDDRPSGSQFSPLAVSHQDFICDYTDRFTRVPSTNDSILNHVPLGVKVHQESYAWNFPFADFFVLMRYVIQNASVDTLDSVYLGIWNNAVVRNTNFVRPGTPGYFEYTSHGYDATQRLAYSFDFSGVPGGPPADSYIGLRLLGTAPFPIGVDSLGDLAQHTYYNAWQFRSSTGIDEYLSPTDDYTSNRYLSRYSRMTQSIPQDRIDALRTGTIKNATYLLSTGPFSRLSPGDSVEVVFAVVCARKNGSDQASRDTPTQRKTLYTNANWAQQAYNGEDANGNNQLDEGEDIARRDSLSPTQIGLRYEPDGRITRYLLPAPPRQPKVRVEVANQSAVIYWDRIAAEESIDPIIGQKDFEGYRIYRSTTGADFQRHEDFLLNLSLIGEFDRSDNNVGYNTGFGQILLNAPQMFVGDTIRYWYRFPPSGIESKLLNGWQYVFGVSAFDTGDSLNNVQSLESAMVLRRIVPGTPPAPDKSKFVGVYPNPYYVNAYWDGQRERLRKIYFYNLPMQSEITIFTLAGDIVTTLQHDASTYSGEDIEWFNQFGDRSTQVQFAGGEHAWDLITRYDQAIATGLYLFTVEDKNTGEIQRGKFLIIK
ncbi:MAG TPA: hypothetical protein VFF29_07485 [Bacteroidota bacterium]|nr:hypothetical protein [Bacteroidota bacterium]